VQMLAFLKLGMQSLAQCSREALQGLGNRLPRTRVFVAYNDRGGHRVPTRRILACLANLLHITLLRRVASCVSLLNCYAVVGPVSSLSNSVRWTSELKGALCFC